MIIFIATKVLGVKLAFDGNGGDFSGFLKATGNFKTLIIPTTFMLNRC